MPSAVKSSVVEKKLDEERRRRCARRQVGPIASLAPSGRKQHPCVRRDAVAEEPFIGAHHAHDNAGGQLVGRRAHERSPEAAARKTDTAEARGLDVCSHSQDVESDPVFMGDRRREAGSQHSAVLGDRVLV